MEEREQIGRWWNGSYGRLNRRDVWLWKTGTGWRVELSVGSLESGERESEDFTDEADARAFVQVALDAVDEQWRFLASGR